jgi:hypothetical protein
MDAFAFSSVDVLQIGFHHGRRVRRRAKLDQCRIKQASDYPCRSWEVDGRLEALGRCQVWRSTVQSCNRGFPVGRRENHSGSGFHLASSAWASFASAGATVTARGVFAPCAVVTCGSAKATTSSPRGTDVATCGSRRLRMGVTSRLPVVSIPRMKSSPSRTCSRRRSPCGSAGAAGPAAPVEPGPLFAKTVSRSHSRTGSRVQSGAAMTTDEGG